MVLQGLTRVSLVPRLPAPHQGTAPGTDHPDPFQPQGRVRLRKVVGGSSSSVLPAHSPACLCGAFNRPLKYQ